MKPNESKIAEFDLEEYLKTLDEMPACNMLPSNLGRMVFNKALDLVLELIKNKEIMSYEYDYARPHFEQLETEINKLKQPKAEGSHE